ncbi:hypothetical protein DXG01_000377 [Tephrocybe rancida]|nr:hypothetical protein DXG01_000377 [Tephrocybe rancida]
MAPAPPPVVVAPPHSCIVPLAVQAPPAMALTVMPNSNPNTTASQPCPMATKSSKIRLARKGKENAPPKASSSALAAPTFAGFSQAFASSVRNASSMLKSQHLSYRVRSPSCISLGVAEGVGGGEDGYPEHADVLSDDEDVEMEELEVEVEAGDVAPDYSAPLPTPVEDELAALFSGLSIIPAPGQLQLEADGFLNDVLMAAPLTHSPTEITSYRPSISAEVPEGGEEDEDEMDEKRSKMTIRYSAFAVDRMMLEGREQEWQEAEERKRHAAMDLIASYASRWQALKAELWARLPSTNPPPKNPYVYSGSYAVAPAQHNQSVPTIGVVRKRGVGVDDDTRPSYKHILYHQQPNHMGSDRPPPVLGRVRRRRV